MSTLPEMGSPTAPPSSLLQAIKIAECVWGQRNTGTRKVMVARTGGLSEGRTRRHVKLSSDAGGLYVRLGKHGAQKRYLIDMEGARIVDTDRNLVVFFEA